MNAHTKTDEKRAYSANLVLTAPNIKPTGGLPARPCTSGAVQFGGVARRINSRHVVVSVMSAAQSDLGSTDPLDPGAYLIHRLANRDLLRHTIAPPKLFERTPHSIVWPDRPNNGRALNVLRQAIVADGSPGCLAGIPPDAAILRGTLSPLKQRSLPWHM
jgi:hypothetical protein